MSQRQQSQMASQQESQHSQPSHGAARGSGGSAGPSSDYQVGSQQQSAEPNWGSGMVGVEDEDVVDADGGDGELVEIELLLPQLRENDAVCAAVAASSFRKLSLAIPLRGNSLSGSTSRPTR